MKVILYSNNCPKCKILTLKLQQNNIEYEEVTDIKTMLDKGFSNVPMLEVDGKIHDYANAVKWISERGN